MELYQHSSSIVFSFIRGDINRCAQAGTGLNASSSSSPSTSVPIQLNRAEEQTPRQTKRRIGCKSGNLSPCKSCWGCSPEGRQAAMANMGTSSTGNGPSCATAKEIGSSKRTDHEDRDPTEWMIGSDWFPTAPGRSYFMQGWRCRIRPKATNSIKCLEHPPCL